MENTVKVGSVVWHIDPTGMFRGPGTVTETFREFDVDYAAVFWQSACVSSFHRLASLLTLAESEARNGNA